MSMKHLSVLLILAMVQLCSCSQPSNPNIPISKASLSLSKNSNPSHTVAFIYDYNPKRLKLEWTACKLVKSSGDQLLDAIQAFIKKNEEKGICKSLELATIDNSKQPVVISFSGKTTFKNKKEKKIFMTALDMTISRNSEQTDFEISFL